MTTQAPPTLVPPDCRLVCVDGQIYIYFLHSPCLCTFQSALYTHQWREWTSMNFQAWCLCPWKEVAVFNRLQLFIIVSWKLSSLAFERHVGFFIIGCCSCSTAIVLGWSCGSLFAFPTALAISLVICEVKPGRPNSRQKASWGVARYNCLLMYLIALFAVPSSHSLCVFAALNSQAKPVALFL